MVLGFPTAKWRGKGKSKRIAKEFSVGPRKNFVSCPRLARQRHFVRRLLTPMQTNFNPTQLRDDSGPLTHYMQSRKEIFMSTQKHKRNKLKEEREKKMQIKICKNQIIKFKYRLGLYFFISFFFFVIFFFLCSIPIKHTQRISLSNVIEPQVKRSHHNSNKRQQYEFQERIGTWCYARHTPNQQIL